MKRQENTRMITIIKTATMLCLMVMSSYPKIHAQINTSTKLIKNQFYLMGGVSQFDDYQLNNTESRFSNYHAEIGTILYFNKKKGPIHFGLNWTLISASNIGDFALIAGSQIGPELSFKPAKPITLSMGYQYRIHTLYNQTEGYVPNTNTAHSIHTYVKVGPVKLKLEYQISQSILLEDDVLLNPSALNLGVGFGF